MKNNEHEPESGLPAEQGSSDNINLYYVPNEKKKTKIHFNFKTFLRSLFTTLLVAILIVLAWRVGIFAVDFYTAKKDGMTNAEAFEFAWSGAADFFTDIVDEVSPVMLSDKNILVIGSDKNKINADVIMLVRLDADTKSVDIISIFRDTMMKVNGKTHKLNAALQLGGEKFLIEKVEEIVDVKIDNYVFLNYEGFKNVIDAIDGVDFYVPQDMYYSDPYQNLYINLKEGQQHLDGDKAEQLVRFRRYPMGDIQRTQVQRDFVTAIYKQKLNSGLVKNYKTLIPALMDFVDTDIGIKDALQYANFVSGFDIDAITAYQLPYKIIEGSPYVHPDTEAIDKMMAEIEAIHNSEKENTEPVEDHFRDDTVSETGRTIE